MSTGIPRYDELPAGPVGGRLGWGVFGEQSELGMLALQTNSRRAAAASLVRSGRTFRLDMPIGALDPPLNANRVTPRHRVIRQSNIGFDDAIDDLYPQAGSQWDSLAHIGYTRESYYGGATDAQVASGARNSIRAVAERGVVGRGVVLDVEQVLLARDPRYRPNTRTEVTVDVLEAARATARVEYEPGDVVLLHTGFTAWYARQPQDVRDRLPGAVRTAGLQQSEEMARYLWDSGIAAIGADNFAVEAWPADTAEAAQPWGFLHQILIGSFGMALGELWWLDDVVSDCRADGVYEGLLVSAPLYVDGGISSPANALFMK